MLNTSLHVDSADFDLLRSPVWRALITALYLMVILMGIIGNSLVVYVVIKHKQLQNITNVFIANLALSDIGLCVFSLPIQLHYQLTDNWVFGSGLCRVVFAAFAMPMYVSTITIMLIAFDRYWIIVYPLRQRMTFKMAIILIFITAVVSLLLSVPVMYFSTLYTVNDSFLKIHRTYCIEAWPVFAARVFYSILMFIFQFVLTLILTAIIYSRIYIKLKQRNLRRHDTERKNRTNKILVAIVAVFVICWLPWNLFSLITEFQRDLMRGKHFKFLDLLLKLFAMSSVCVNPFLYCWLNDNFRREVDNIVIKFKKRTAGIRVPNGRSPQPTYDESVRPTSRIEKPELTVNNHLTVTIMVDQASTPKTPYKKHTHLLVPGNIKQVNSHKDQTRDTTMENKSEFIRETKVNKKEVKTLPGEQKGKQITRTHSFPTFRYTRFINTKRTRVKSFPVQCGSHLNNQMPVTVELCDLSGLQDLNDDSFIVESDDSVSVKSDIEPQNVPESPEMPKTETNTASDPKNTLNQSTRQPNGVLQANGKNNVNVIVNKLT